MILTIEYLNGEQEQIYVDDCGESDNCLYYYIRFGVKEGMYHVPLANIKRYKVSR